ncbi:phosphatase [Spiribacter halobius]|uniref:Phosphatase n=2 Tax=Sediminicurvatus halobius TaxID=2182432 RepID=A0A2U2N8F3_9GAMM|nr:phosphatase [Spiribacter halobius]
MKNTPVSRVDLHLHSTASDGRLPPADVMQRAADAGVGLAALTDHDTVAGLDEAAAAARRLGITLVPGSELSARWARGTLHIVGLGLDPQAPGLEAGLARHAAVRHERARRMAERLARHGAPALHEQVLAMTGGAPPGRQHFARALVAAGVVADSRAAFRRFLARGRPAYAPAEWAPLADVVGWIHGAGGLAVFAHPTRYGLSRGALREALKAFVAAGGDAVEVACGGFGPGDVGQAAALARRHGLAASVGSDFHDPEFPWIGIGRLPPLPGDLEPVWRRRYLGR